MGSCGITASAAAHPSQTQFDSWRPKMGSQQHASLRDEHQVVPCRPMEVQQHVSLELMLGLQYKRSTFTLLQTASTTAITATVGPKHYKCFRFPA